MINRVFIIDPWKNTRLMHVLTITNVSLIKKIEIIVKHVDFWNVNKLECQLIVKLK